MGSRAVYLKGDEGAANSVGCTRSLTSEFLILVLRDQDTQRVRQHPCPEVAGRGEHLTVYVRRGWLGERHLDLARPGKVYLGVRKVCTSEHGRYEA